MDRSNRLFCKISRNLAQNWQIIKSSIVNRCIVRKCWMIPLLGFTMSCLVFSRILTAFSMLLICKSCGRCCVFAMFLWKSPRKQVSCHMYARRTPEGCKLGILHVHSSKFPCNYKTATASFRDFTNKKSDLVIWLWCNLCIVDKKTFIVGLLYKWHTHLPICLCMWYPWWIPKW